MPPGKQNFPTAADWWGDSFQAVPLTLVGVEAQLIWKNQDHCLERFIPDFEKESIKRGGEASSKQFLSILSRETCTFLDFING